MKKEATVKFTNLFVVYDPTQTEQPALERAAAIAKETSASLHLYACIYSDLDDATDGEQEQLRLVSRQKDTLNQAVILLRGCGVNVTTEVEWDKDWYQAVVTSSAHNEADVVFKSSYHHSSQQRVLKKTSDWTLIRECHCPVLLVKQGDQRDMNKVLAAIDIREGKATYKQLNENILGFSKKLLDSRNAEVHFINAFKDLKSTPDRSALVRSCGVDSERVHIRMGEPDQVIIESARELEAGLVVVGNSARSGLSAVINGNTVEKVLDRLDCDVLCMP